MATHSSILAWRTPWAEEPGRLQSMGLQRVGHDWVTDTLSWQFSKYFKSFIIIFVMMICDQWSFMLMCLVAQLCPTLYDPMDCNPSGFSVHGNLQARRLKWVAMPFSSLSYYCCNCFGHHQRWWTQLINVCIWLLHGMTASPPPSLFRSPCSLRHNKIELRPSS